MATEKYTAQQMIDALKETKGMVHLAADRLGCVHQTVYNYIERYPTVKAAHEHESGKVTDTAELKLYQAILAGDAWAVTFYLKTKGKGRGYTERVETEHTGRDGGPIRTVNMSLEEFKKEAAAREGEADKVLAAFGDEDA